MPLDPVARSYADGLLWQELEQQIQKEYVQRMVAVNARFAGQRSGLYAQEVVKVILWHAEQFIDARKKSLVNAYEKAGLSFDDSSLKEIQSELAIFARAQQGHAMSAMSNRLTQMQMLQTDAVKNSLGQQIERGVSGAVAKANRELTLKRQETILDERRVPAESAALPARDEKEKNQAGKPFRQFFSLLSVVAIAVNLAVQLTIAKYGANIPDSLIIGVWILTLVSFAGWGLTHPNLIGWMKERFKVRPVSTTALAVVGTFVVLFCAASLAFIGRGVWHRITKPHNAVALPAPNVTPPPPHPYDLSGDRRLTFEEALRKQTGSRALIRVGCTAWSEESCVAAGRFLIAFSEAGWKVDSNEVFRLEPKIPIDGVALVTNDPKAQAEAARLNLPPHKGVWHKMSPSEVTFYSALRGLNIPVSSSSDPSLPKGTVGIYFGPEPH